MNTNTKDVVKNVESKNVESTSNEQRQTNKPIVISRRRLLRAGVAGIPVVLTMTGLAPGQGLQDKWSAASGLVYSGTGRGVRARFDQTDMVSSDNLVWSNQNGFVYDKDSGKLFTHPITPTLSDFNATSLPTITITEVEPSDSDNPLSKSVTVAAIALSAFNTPSFIAYLHKAGVCYTDLLVYGNDDNQTIDEYYEDCDITDFLTFTVDGNTLGENYLSATPSDNKFTVTLPSDSVLGADGKAYYPLSKDSDPAYVISITFNAHVDITNYTSDSKEYAGGGDVSFSFNLNIPSLNYNASDWQKP